MTTIVINLPPKECSLMKIYKMLSAFGNSKKMRDKYKKTLEDHLKSCEICKRYDEYKRNENEY